MVIDPWGEVLLDGGRNTGVHVLEIDMSEVEHTRRHIPSLTHDRDIQEVRIVE